MSLLSSSSLSGARGAMTPFVAGLASLLLLATLSGCSSIGNALGINKRPPDEFSVVGRAPLVVPPDFNLMPPQEGKPGELKKNEVDPRKLAYQALFPARATQPAAQMPAAPQGEVSGAPLSVPAADSSKDVNGPAPR